jgi:hypothetical protein
MALFIKSSDDFMNKAISADRQRVKAALKKGRFRDPFHEVWPVTGRTV